MSRLVVFLPSFECAPVATRAQLSSRALETQFTTTRSVVNAPSRSTTHLGMRWFQPIWGTGRAMLGSNLLTWPGMMPSPSQPPFSSEPSNRSCIPRQMPRKGLSACLQMG